MNDLTAIGAIRAASERGIRVPEDLSVIGIDNIPLGDFLHRRLTTIAQPLDELANATAELLLQEFKGQPSFRKLISRKLINDSSPRSLT